MKHSISVVVPVYNERELLCPALEVLDEFLSSCFREYEVLIVESGSDDGTCELCDVAAQRWRRIRVIHEGVRRGIGSATRMGFAAATMELVWLVTVDLPFPLDAILRAVPLFEKCDCVLSCRSRDERGPFRQLQSGIYNRLAKTLLDLRVQHINSAFKVFRRETVQSFRLTSNTGFIDTEIVYWVTRTRTRYAVIPVDLVERKGGKSSVTLNTAWHMVRELLAFCWKQKLADIGKHNDVVEG